MSDKIPWDRLDDVILIAILAVVVIMFESLELALPLVGGTLALLKNSGGNNKK